MREAPGARRIELGTLQGPPGTNGTREAESRVDASRRARWDAAGILLTALTQPEALAEPALDALDRVLARCLEPDPSETRELALAALAAVLAARPALVRAAWPDRLVSLLQDGASAPAIRRVASRLLAVLPSTPYAPRAWQGLLTLLRADGVDPAIRSALVPVLRDFVQWAPDLVALDAILELAARPELAGSRDFILGHVVEPLAYARPAEFDGPVLGRLVDVFGESPRWRYLLAALEASAETARSARAWAAARLVREFPLRREAMPLLNRLGRLLVVHNVATGQGDEIVRVVPMVQAFLDARPALAVVVLTARRHLYDHPRVVPISIRDAATAREALAESFDAVVEFYEPAAREASLEPALHEALARRLDEGKPPPVVIIQGDVGDGHFRYRTVDLGGRELARPLGLDRRTVESIYDPCRRLLAELGLPRRVAEQEPAAPAVLTGLPSADALAAWARLRARLGDAGAGGRPIALVNPFGGAWPLKGFEARPARLAVELSGLVAEGYTVVLLPNGTPWGGAEAVACTLALLPRETRASVVAGPDPDEPDGAARLPLVERPELPYADRVMRLFKYFATYADLVATTEGWMAHLACCLGRPFRLVLAPQSFSFDWHPDARGPRQELRVSWSAKGWAPAWSGELLGPTDPAPLPSPPRKALLEIALRALGLCEVGEALPLLVRALASDDWDIRAAAVAGLGRLTPVEPAVPYLLRALRDRHSVVRREAAEALLGRQIDCRPFLGLTYRECLEAHLGITHQDWRAVWRLGGAALPALFVAADDAAAYLRREARIVLGRLLSLHLPALPRPSGLRVGAGGVEDAPFRDRDCDSP